MKLTIIAVGSKMPNWVEEAYSDYSKRMPADYLLSLKEVKPEPRTSGKSTQQIMAAEAKRIQSHLHNDALCFALDERGKTFTSTQLAQTLEQWRDQSPEVFFIIGGADGLDASLKSQCNGLIRLSDLTLPHGMVRVFLAEQLYRAWSINHNHPYHRV